MNILADEQQKKFEPGICQEEKAKREQAFYDLYYKTRKKDENSFLGKLSLKTRKRLHKLVLLVFAVKNRLSGFSCKVIKDVKGIVNDCFVSNPDVSSRQIPSRFRFREKLPLSANGKVSFNEIIKEGLTGEEITVELEETTISVGSITVK